MGCGGLVGGLSGVTDTFCQKSANQALKIWAPYVCKLRVGGKEREREGANQDLQGLFSLKNNV